MYFLNPTIFEDNKQLYCLIRQETDVNKWNISILSYSLCKLDEKLNIIEQKQCKFKINNNTFHNVSRTSLTTDKYCIEDIKIYKCKINEQIIGTANILIRQNPRIFRCGIIKLNIHDYTIELVKILEVENMNDDEKNWTLFHNHNKYYIIYSLFPELKIYNLDIHNNYKLHLYKIKNIYKKIKNSDLIKNLNNYYKHLYLTSSCIISKDNGNFIIISKSRKNTNMYDYYKLEFDFINFDINVNFNCLFSGKKCYLNDVKLINNNYIECWGMNDTSYDFSNRIF